MSKYILIYLWGAFTISFWFLAFIKMPNQTINNPNGFIALAVISTIASIVIAVLLTLKENKKLF